MVYPGGYDNHHSEVYMSSPAAAFRRIPPAYRGDGHFWENVGDNGNQAEGSNEKPDQTAVQKLRHGEHTGAEIEW
jgi:hypothetical protein